MKTIALILSGAALLAAATQPTQTRPEKAKTLAQQRADAAAARARQGRTVRPAAPVNTHKTVQPAIPPDAVQVEPNLYRHTDAQGKTWLYRRTPFGVSRWEDSPSSQAPAEPKQDAPVTATDLGDKVQYERQTPFGTAKWTRKKTDLGTEENAPKPAAHAASTQSQNKVAEKQ